MPKDVISHTYLSHTRTQVMYVLSIAKYYTASNNAYVSWSENEAIHCAWAWPNVVNQLYKTIKVNKQAHISHLKYLSDRPKQSLHYKEDGEF